MNAFARRSATNGFAQPAIGSHTNDGNPGANPNGSNTATGPTPERRDNDKNKSSGFVNVTNAAPGAVKKKRPPRRSTRSKSGGTVTGSTGEQ